MKQTAVEWFKEELEKQLDFKAVEKFWGGLYDKAKEMEKGQIMKTWYDCKLSIIERNPTDAEQYYNETFKSE